jgi:hypothetical protein
VDIDSSETLLISEYERSSEFCNHVDNVRNVITSFFLTLVGAATFALNQYTSGELKPGSLGSPAARVGYLLAGIAITGVLFVMTIARLRRIQTERYQMMNAILDAVLTSQHRRLLPYRNDRIPTANSAHSPFNKRLSGSYIWTVILILPTAATAGLSIYFGLRAAVASDLLIADLVGPAAGILVTIGCDRLFWLLSKP